MKTYENNALRETAVYWGNPVPSGDGGVNHDSPIEIKCRWELKQELFVGFDGKEHISSAIVYADRDVVLEGWLKLGYLNDLESGRDIDDQADAFRIQAIGRIKNRRGTKVIRKVWL